MVVISRPNRDTEQHDSHSVLHFCQVSKGLPGFTNNEVELSRKSRLSDAFHCVCCQLDHDGWVRLINGLRDSHAGQPWILKPLEA